MRTIRGAGGKNKGGALPRLPVEASDSLRSTSFAYVLDLLAEGEIEGLVDGLKSVYLDGTPVQNPDGTMNFTGVSLATVNGTQNQDPIAGFGGTEQEFAVGLEVVFATPIVRTITNPEADAVRVNVTVPALTRQNAITGDIVGSEVQVAIEVQSNGGGYVAANLSRHWVPIANPGTTPGTGVDIRVEWSVLNSFTFQTIKFDVQYREVGAGSWITIKQDSFTSAQKFTNRGPRFYDKYFTVSRNYRVVDLPELYYEARVVVTSGPGTLTIPFFEVLLAIPFDIIRGKASSEYQRSYRVELTGSPPWDVKVVRHTADSVSALIQNKTYFYSYAELTDEKFSYPNSALAGLSIDAEQFSTVPVRGYDVKLLRCQIPSNYDPVTREYTGIWDGTFTIAWTDNPAWCFYALLINTRFGLGNYLSASQIDKWALYTIGQYCDGMVPDGEGGMEPRFTCNLYLQTQEEAFSVIASMASIFRGMAYWEAGAITAVQDSPADPVFLFTAANVEEGLFTYSGSAKSARHTVALVSWSDPEDGFKLKPEYVEDAEGIARYGVSTVTLAAFGCISRGEAHRVGEWILYSERHETEIVIFRCGHDGVFVRPGNIFAIQDQHRAGIRFGGRLRSATVASVEIDAAITIETGQAYTLQVVLPDGTLDTKAIVNAPGSAVNLSVSPDFDVAPDPLAVWILTSTAVSPRLYRCISIVEPDRQTYEVTGVAHEPGKFDYIERSYQLIAPNYTTVRTVPARPTNLVISESYTIKDGAPSVTVTVTWDRVSTASRYVVEYRRDDGNFETVTVGTASIDIENALLGYYDVMVRAVNVLGIQSPASALATKRIFGKVEVVTSMSGLSLSQTGNILTVSWQPSEALDIDYYEIRAGSSNWPYGILLGRTSANNFLFMSFNIANNILVAAYDKSGNHSEPISGNGPGSDSDALIAVSSDYPTWGGTKTNTEVVSNLLRLTAGSMSGTYVSVPMDLGAVQKVFIELTSALTLHDRGLTWDDLTEPWSFYESPWAGPGGDDQGSVIFELAISQDASSYAAYVPYLPGVYTGRAFKYRVTLISADGRYAPQIVGNTELTAHGVVRTVSLLSQSIANGGSSIGFPTDFVAVRNAIVTIVSGAIGDTFRVTALSTSSITVVLYDAAGATKAGTVDINVVGHGEV